MNKQAEIDARNVVTGKDGEVFISTSKGNILLSEADAFQVQLNFTNTDYQPIGSAWTYAVDTAQSATLTITESVIRDNIMLKPLYDDLAKGRVPQFSFQGKISRRDGKEQRQVFRNCIPDGSVDLMNITPGEIIKRPWSFRLNATPELMSYFGEGKRKSDNL